MSDDRKSAQAEWKPDVVLYHAHCTDGFAAAWACWRKWGEAGVIGGLHHGERHPQRIGERLRLMELPSTYDVRPVTATEASPEMLTVRHVEYRLARFFGGGRGTPRVEHCAWVPASVPEGEEMAHVLRLALADTKRGGSFKCAARRNGSFQTPGGGDPKECDWPTCGCDDYATKVIQALQEAGYLKEIAPPADMKLPAYEP